MGIKKKLIIKRQGKIYKNNIETLKADGAKL